MATLTNFTLDATRRAVLNPCIDNYDVGDDSDGEWPNNILSRRTVVYGSGTIARDGEAVTFAVDSEELDLCVRLANEAAALMEGEEVGMGSESGAGWSAFWIVAYVDEKVEQINENLIRARFNGTIFPPATIQVGPLSSNSDPFNAVLAGLEEIMADDPENAHDHKASQEKWKALVSWFESQSDFQDIAWVEIGDTEKFGELPEENYPPGTEMVPCVLPRLLLGLTQTGSLCGLFGFVVQT